MSRTITKTHKVIEKFSDEGVLIKKIEKDITEECIDDTPVKVTSTYTEEPVELKTVTRPAMEYINDVKPLVSPEEANG